MIAGKELKKRDLYLDKLKAFQNTEPVKVVTGIRRCGKSSLLRLMAAHLRESGVEDAQIVEMNFESHEFGKMTSDELYEYVRSHAIPGKRMYLFLDEVQRVTGWEDAVNAFRVDLDCDIYVTGSNAWLLTSEYSTYLSGRCVEIKMLPLSFAEFLYFHGYEVGRTAAGRLRVTDASGERWEPQEVFELYLRYGGMPGIAEVGLDQERAMTLLDGVYSTVIVRDILEREKRQGQSKITDSVLLRKIALFLADNVGNSVSMTSIGNTLTSTGLLSERKRGGTPSVHTVQAYVEALVESYFFYDVRRWDIKGKELLRTLGKYYVVDLGLRNYLLGYRNRDVGHVLENVVYFELLRRGYDVAVGKIDNLEVDFVASGTRDKLYIQVTETMLGEEVRERELRPLRRIQDNYEKLILSLDTGLETDYEGIRSQNLVEWLLTGSTLNP